VESCLKDSDRLGEHGGGRAVSTSCHKCMSTMVERDEMNIVGASWSEKLKQAICLIVRFVVACKQ
jgi:hypothetical protein